MICLALIDHKSPSLVQGQVGALERGVGMSWR